MYRRILVATDGSRLSRTAIAHAVALAKSTAATVVGFHARASYPLAYYGDPAIMMPLESRQVFAEQSVSAAKQYLAKIEAAARRAGVRYKGVHVASLSPSQAIINTARKEKCDLIVMASHGRKGVSRLLLGSETNQVLTHSRIPVLVTR